MRGRVWLRNFVSRWAALGSGLLYGVLATVIVFVNKSLFVTFQFQHVFVITIGQLLLSWSASTVMSALGFITIPSFSHAIFWEVLPLSVTFVANVLFGIAGLGAVNVPMYVALRRLGVLFTLILQKIMLRKSPSFPIVFSVAIIILGGFVAAVGDSDFEIMGYILVLMNNITGSLNLISIKKSENKLGTFGLMHYNNIISLPFVLFCATISGEWTQVYHYPRLCDTEFISVYLLSGICAFFLNYTLFLCTKLNSPLTTSVIVQVKNSATTILGLSFFTQSDITSIESLMGHTISTMGGGLYCFFSYTETKGRERHDNPSRSQAKSITV